MSNKVIHFSISSLLIFVVCSYFEGVFWGFYLLPHFRLHYLVASVLLMLILTWQKKKIGRIWVFYLGALLLAALVQSVEIFPYYGKRDRGLETINEANQTLTLFLWNTWTKNTNNQEIYECIIDVHPQIILLQESHHSLADDLRNRLPSYQFFSAGDNLFFVKEDDYLTIDSFREISFTKATGGELSFEWNSKTISLLGIHLSAPVPINKITDRKDQVTQLIEWIKYENNSPILMGDLNTSPWSTEHKKISELLHDSMMGFGIQTTWPFHNIITSLLRIPLDHCFHSHELITVNRVSMPSKGSNHRPVVVQLQIKEEN
ncbi:MAG: endonuclease/exonuclease/phosphatase family protein [Bacteroidota bacterium]